MHYKEQSSIFFVGSFIFFYFFFFFFFNYFLWEYIVCKWFAVCFFIFGDLARGGVISEQPLNKTVPFLNVCSCAYKFLTSFFVFFFRIFLRQSA